MPETPRIPLKKGAVSKRHSRLPLILIGIGKLLKATGLIGVSIVAAKLLKREQHQALEELLNQWRLDPHSHHLHWLLQKMLSIDEKQLRLLRVGTLIYAGLFSVEGLGLLFDKAWAEWLLVVSTALLLPVEIWELIDRGTWPPGVIFVINVIILIYVCFRLKWRIQDRRHQDALAAESASVRAADSTPVGIKP